MIEYHPSFPKAHWPLAFRPKDATSSPVQEFPSPLKERPGYFSDFASSEEEEM